MSNRIQFRLKYFLPLAQMALAVYLLWSTYRCEAAFKRIYDAPPIPHAFTLLVFMNAPANLLRWAWFYHVDGVWSDAMFVALIGLLWYWVALSICSWRERRSIVLFSSAPMRVVADLALIAMGPTIALGFRPVDVAHLPWLWRIPVAACFLVWSLGPVIIFGHDLIDCFRRKGSLSGKAA